MRILLVENHAAFAETVTRQFLAGHEVHVAPTLAAARYAGRDFDAVLVDFDLDDGKGDELVRELVAGAYPGRIVAISAHDAGNDALLAAGARSRCPKLRFHEIAQHLG